MMTGSISFLHSVLYKMAESEQKCVLAASTSQCDTEVGYYRAESESVC
jgi:hypothetical protein